MEMIILAVTAFVFGWVAGALITTIKQAQAFKSILQDLGVTTEQLLALKRKIDSKEEPQAESRENIVEIVLEQHNDIIYAYRKSDSQFLAQGQDRDALIQHLNHTFARGARLIIREQDGAHLVKTL